MLGCGLGGKWAAVAVNLAASCAGGHAGSGAPGLHRCSLLLTSEKPQLSGKPAGNVKTYGTEKRRHTSGRVQSWLALKEFQAAALMIICGGSAVPGRDVGRRAGGEDTGAAVTPSRGSAGEGPVGAGRRMIALL
ncbi:unnamed protein product [Lota lota]